MNWKKHKEKWSNCQDCDLCECRTRTVLGRGKIPCDILMIGEAPGMSEDTLGTPFIGPAGHLLDRIIDKSVPSWLRLAFTTLVACIPKDEEGNKVKEPPKKSIVACGDRLKDFIYLCKPKAIVLVGKLPAKHVPARLSFGKDLPWIDEDDCLEFTEIPHPAYILRADIYQRTMALKKSELALADLVSLEKFHLDN